jgi:hypothetical protein
MILTHSLKPRRRTGPQHFRFLGLVLSMAYILSLFLVHETMNEHIMSTGASSSPSDDRPSTIAHTPYRTLQSKTRAAFTRLRPFAGSGDLLSTSFHQASKNRIGVVPSRYLDALELNDTTSCILSMLNSGLGDVTPSGPDRGTLWVRYAKTPPLPLAVSEVILSRFKISAPTPPFALQKSRPSISEAIIIFTVHYTSTAHSMAPPYTTLSAATLRIPLHRFGTHVFLSALAALIPQLLQKWDILILSPLWAVACVLSADFILESRNRTPNHRSLPYCLALGLSLSYLHHLTTLLGRHLVAPEFSSTQHVAVQFACAFWVITEFEFYRAYTTDFKAFASPLEALKYGWKANIDTTFCVSREPYHFGYMSIVITDSTRRREVGIWFAQYCAFMFVCGLFNLGIKYTVDPEWSGTWEEVGKGLVAANGFFTSERVLQVAINLPVLMRVVRQANHVVVLTVWDLWVGTRKARGNRDAEVKNCEGRVGERLDTMV